MQVFCIKFQNNGQNKNENKNENKIKKTEQITAP